MLLLGIRLLYTWNIGIQAAALAAMAARPTPAVLYAGSLVVGLAVGNMITLPPILTREEFGSHAFGTIFGMVSAASQAGLAFGPALIGLIRDTQGSYQPALWGPGRLGSARHRRRALGPGAARRPRASTCGVIAAHRGAAHHER